MFREEIYFLYWLNYFEYRYALKNKIEYVL